MSDQEKVKIASFAAIAGLTAVLIAVISARSAFPEILFYLLVTFFTGGIALLIGYMFLWERTSRYVRKRLWRRKQNILARRHFEDFREMVERFTSLREFSSISQGITGILSGLPLSYSKESSWISKHISEFPYIMQNPLNDFKQRLTSLHYEKSQINEKTLSNLAHEFENYVMLHKRLYVDLTVTTARELGLQNVAADITRLYAEYRDDYNQFIIAYTEFAKKTQKELGVFSQSLQKAYEM